MTEPLDRLLELGAALGLKLGLSIPPPVFEEMKGELLDYLEGQSLQARFPVARRYQNPMGAMQGGMIAAAMDNTLGPLSFLVAPPSTTTQLNVTYLRPVTADLAYIYVEARVEALTRRQVILSARVSDDQGRLLALGQAIQVVVRPGSGRPIQE